jgi:hypothetical protein
MSSKKLIYMILGILLLFGMANAQIPDGLTIANDFVPGFGLSIGNVFMIDGTAIVVHDNQNIGYQVFKGMLLFQKDTLYTNQPGRVLLNMQDGSQLTIGSQSQLTLNKINLMPQKKMRKSFISMKRGKARFNVRKLSQYKQTDYKVKTQTALIGVRGSDFFVTANQTSTSVTTFDKTKLSVLGLAKPHLPPTLLNDFQRVHVDSGDQPSEIEHVSPDEIQQLKQEFKYDSKPTAKGQTKTDKKSETDSDSDSKTTSDESEETTTDNQQDTQSSDTASAAVSQDEQSATDETKSDEESSEPESQSQDNVLIPTQEIVAPDTIDNAQAPSMDQVVSNDSEITKKKQESNTVEQIQEIYEHLHEKDVMLPSFPETP